MKTQLTFTTDIPLKELEGLGQHGIWTWIARKYPELKIYSFRIIEEQHKGKEE